MSSQTIIQILFLSTAVGNMVQSSILSQKKSRFWLYKQLISLIMKPSYCQLHPGQQILLVCLQPCCPNKLICLQCLNQHYRHDVVSLEYFSTQILSPMQRNRNNPERVKIIKQLNATMQSMLNKLHHTRNKINALIGNCEDCIEQYFGKLFSSFAVPSEKQVKQQLDKNLSSKLISELMSQVGKVEKMVIGTFQENNAMTYFTKQIFQQKTNEMFSITSQAINTLKSFILQVSFAKPEKFQLSFNRQKLQKGSYSVSDQGLSVERVLGNGGFPLCLSATPFNPLNPKFSFTIQKSTNNRSVCIGACIQNIVRSNNFSNCFGFGKGIYAIDQNSPYSSGTVMASWNHHDTQFNQANVGSNDLIGWTLKQGDTVTMHLDYFNSVLAFMKISQNQDQEMAVYQMPIKLDVGPIYPFVSLANKGDVVRIIEVEMLQ